MLISIHDHTLKRVGFLSNDDSETPDFKDDNFHRYLAQGTSTFDFTVNKIKNGVVQDYVQLLNERAYFSFQYEGEDFLFDSVIVEEDDDKITFNCLTLNLEMRNEEVKALKNTASHNIQWYFDQLGLINFAKISLGINQVENDTRTINYDSEDTKLARLISVIQNFDAEFEFVTKLKRDGTLDNITLNIYKKNDGGDIQGVGQNRNDVLLSFGENVTGVNRKVEKSQIFNSLYVTGKDGLSWKNSSWSVTNSEGQEEFYKRAGESYAKAPLSAQMFPSQLQSSSGDIYTNKNVTTEYTTVNAMWGYALSQLKQYAYPLVTYEVTATSNLTVASTGDGMPLHIGDTVRIQDKNFIDSDGNVGLFLSARVSELEISFTNPTNNKITFSNYIKLKSEVSDDLTARMQEIINANTPYRPDITSTNGLQFKNGTGTTTLGAHIYFGSEDKETIADSYEWSKDGTVVADAQTITVDASGVTDKAVYSFKATVAGKVVGTQSVTITNVDDGTNGRSVTNVSQKWRLTTTSTAPTQAWSDAGWLTTQPTTTVTNKYLWSITRTTFNLAPLTQDIIEQKAVYGDKGDKGDQGVQGIQGLQGPTGTQGIAGPKGADGKTQYTHIAYANSADGKTDFSTSDSNRTYIGMYVDFNINDSTTPSDYSWTLVKGADGTQGTPGKPGADGKTPYFHTAWSYSADGTDGFTTVYPNLNLAPHTELLMDTNNNFIWGNKASATNTITYEKVSVPNQPRLVNGIHVTQTTTGQAGWRGPFYSQTTTASIPCTPNTKYTTSAWVKNNASTDVRISIALGMSATVNQTSPTFSQNNITVPADGNWHYITYTHTTNANAVFMWPYVYTVNGTTSADFSFAGYKLEPGSTATPYMPSSSEVTTADWPSYIGQYTDFTQADSTNPSDYTWSRMRGNDGADGQDGKDGTNGKDGDPGSPGAPGTSAINIDLSNKAYNFIANLEVSDSGSVMQAVAGSTTTTFTALQGTAAINITALTCTTTLPTGMTVSIGTLNALSVVVTISVDNTMITPNGVLNFSITAGGVTTTKSFSYSLAINDLTVINLAAINSNLGNVKNIYSHYNGSDGGTYSGTIEINDENIKITATNDNDSNEVSKTQMNGENGIWHSTKLQKANSPRVYVLSNWSLTGTTLSFESQQSDLTYPNGYSYASYGIDVHARNIVGDSISQTNDVRTWTPITLNNVTSAVLMYKIINGVIHLNGQGNWGSFTANQSKTVATLPAALCPTRTVNKIITTQNTNNNDKPMEIQIQTGGDINIWSMPASTSGRYGGFEESYPLG
ncbi:phage tail protein [Lactococcus lactis]|uniref:phage tail protein n=1 Tax=Lactococcus lactis TaxID=1358 RepID=UPI0028BD2514|nr:phage tail protein [Lactococcus lactis]WNN67381.1 phage tail protein [Lactococcus lactis]WPK09872.1 phage tail protein [Lactococcus lactis]